MIRLFTLENLLAAYKGKHGVYPALITAHPDTHLSVRRQTPVFNKEKGIYEIFGIHFLPTLQVPVNEIHFYASPMKNTAL